MPQLGSSAVSCKQSTPGRLCCASAGTRAPGAALGRSQAGIYLGKPADNQGARRRREREGAPGAGAKAVTEAPVSSLPETAPAQGPGFRPGAHRIRHGLLQASLPLWRQRCTQHGALESGQLLQHLFRLRVSHEHEQRPRKSPRLWVFEPGELHESLCAYHLAGPGPISRRELVGADRVTRR
jgi:hypothetical protein